MPIYFYQNNPRLPISIESIGNQWLQEEVVRTNGYPYYHWLQTTTGHGIVEINDQLIPLAPGTGILILPFVPHHYYPHGKTAWQTNFVTLQGELMPDFLKTFSEKNYLLGQDSPLFSYSEWINQRIDTDQEQALDPLVASSNCYHFLLALMQQQNTDANEKHHLYQRYLSPILQEIETNYAQTLTVTGLAEQIYVSPQYLSRLFQRFLGQSTSQYLLNYRLNRAKELLVSKPHMDIQEIAFFVGIQDASHFTALFKKKVGTTPKKFRQLYR
jgi:AraC-like DNA-binding protein